MIQNSTVNLVRLGLLAGALAAWTAACSPAAKTENEAAAAQKTVPVDLNGTWAGPVDEFTEDGIPVAAVTRNVGWAPFSQGLPEERKAPSAEDQLKRREQFLAAFRKLANSRANVFAPDAFGPVPENPSLTDAGRDAVKKAQAESPLRKIEASNENALLKCYPQNVLSIGDPVTIVQGTNAIVFFASNAARIVYMDGRDIDAAPLSDYLGYSVGKWDGDTLVITTKYFRGNTFGGGFAGLLYPMSEQTTLTEYVSKTDGGKTLQIKSVLDDPILYKEKIGKMTHLSSAPDTIVVNENCIEGMAGGIEYDATKFKAK